MCIFSGRIKTFFLLLVFVVAFCYITYHYTLETPTLICSSNTTDTKLQIKCTMKIILHLFQFAKDAYIFLNTVPWHLESAQAQILVFHQGEHTKVKLLMV